MSKILKKMRTLKGQDIFDIFENICSNSGTDRFMRTLSIIARVGILLQEV